MHGYMHLFNFPNPSEHNRLRLNFAVNIVTSYQFAQDLVKAN